MKYDLRQNVTFTMYVLEGQIIRPMFQYVSLLCRNLSTDDICDTVLARFLYLTIPGTKQGAEERT